MKKYLQKFFVITAFGSVSISLFSQGVGINTTGATPSVNSILDLNTGNTTGADKYKLGFIVPHVELGASLATFGMAHSATVNDTGMMVYNMNSTLQPIGYYYWNGSTWVSVSGSGAANAWLLTGNSGTTVGTNYLGTNDNNALEFKVDLVQSGLIEPGNGGNVYLGTLAGNTNTPLSFNAGLGYNALAANTSGSGNSAVGANALKSTTTGAQNTALGDGALQDNITGQSNTALGMGALENNTASNNTATGWQALEATTSGGNNTAVGYGALYSNVAGNQSTAIGYEAMYYANNQTTAITTQNVAVGYQALYGSTTPANNTGTENTAIGYQALYANSSGYENTASGFYALYSNTQGGNNTASGYYSLYTNTTGTENTAYGASSLILNSTGTNNTATGYGALFENNGFYNTATGSQALWSNTTGEQNTATGDGALFTNTTGLSNTATGYSALYKNSTGAYNTAEGFWALYNNTTASSLTALGMYAGLNNTTGDLNVYIGDSAGYNNTTGSKNTFVGYQSGTIAAQAASTNCTYIGYQAAAPAAATNNMICLGNTSVSKIYAEGAYTITAYSDRRIKDNIKENVPGLAFINKLRPVTYHLNIHRENQLLDIKDDGDWPGKYDIEKITQSGFIAQEVDSAARACGYDFCGLDKPKSSNGLYALGYTCFVVPLVKAVQELSAENDSLKNANNIQETKIEMLQKNQVKEEADIAALKKTVNSMLSAKQAGTQAEADAK